MVSEYTDMTSVGAEIMYSLTHSILFFDDHSGSMLVFLTTVYVIGTLLMWHEMRKSRMKMDEPNIQVSLEPQARWGNFFDLVISNIGNVPVYNLSLEIMPKGLKTIGERKLEDINLFKRSIPVFGKNQTIRTFAISYPDFINSSQSKQITFNVLYKTLSGKSTKQEFLFDMEVYKNMSASHESNLNDVVSEMKNMTKEIEKMAKLTDLTR
jgi:hypothetical protein